MLVSPVTEKPVVAKSDLPGSAHLSSEEGGHAVSQSKQHRNENWPSLHGRSPPRLLPHPVMPASINGGRKATAEMPDLESP